MQKFSLWAAAAVAISTALSAEVPPVDWKPKSYTGPGFVCSDGFALRLEAGETATRGFPSEGYIPLHVRSNGGSFAVVEYSFNRPKLKKQLLSRLDKGNVYLVQRVIMDVASGVEKRRSYWFEPTAPASSPFGLDFYKAVEGQGGWGEFPSSKYEEIVTRLQFDPRGPAVECLP